MPTPLDQLSETVADGDDNHPQMHSDLAYYVKRIAALAGLDTTVASSDVTLLSAMVSGELLPRLKLYADGSIAMSDPIRNIQSVSGTTTVTVTTTANHYYGTGDYVKIAEVGGISGVNGTWLITRTGATTFTLDGAVGAGTYTTGGRVQRQLGHTSSTHEGQWNFVMPDGADEYGMKIRLNGTTLKAGFAVVDYQNADIFIVLPAGGSGVSSADNRDGLWVSEDTTGRSAFLNTGGGLRLAYGDPAGGVEVLALGDIPSSGGTAPGASTMPDGTHTAEFSFTTGAGAVIWGPVSSGGRLRMRTRAGHEDELIAPVHRRQMEIAAPGGGSTLVSTGVAAPTVASTNITPAADDTAGGPGTSYTTTAASGVDAGLITALTLLQTRWGPLSYTRMLTDASAITSTRLIVGLVSADNSANAGPASSGAYATAAGAWFRYDTGVDGTAFWRTVTGDGANATVTTTTTAIAAATEYELKIEVNSAGTSVRFFINNALVATHTTNLPTTSTGLGYLCRLRTLTTSARALRFGRAKLSSK